MSDRDFEIGSRKFKLNKINALKQFHLVRRIAPILAELAPSMGDLHRSMKNAAELTEDQRIESIGKFVAPIMSGLSKLTDKDAELVLHGLLEAVEMQQEGQGWARLARDNRLMFDDLDLPLLLNAAGRAFAFNLSGFFAVHQQLS